MPFTFLPLKMPDVILVIPKFFEDGRGFFLEAYKWSEFAAQGIRDHFVQDNHSRSTRGVLRGLHYQQPPKAQAKLVRVLQGEVFDVAVDIRQGSPTYGQWVGLTLSASDARMLYVPAGFAHGFCVTSATAEVVYKVSEEYAPETEAGLAWNDPDIGIEWPIETPVLTRRDAQYPLLMDIEPVFFYRKGSAAAVREAQGGRL
ncbi:MAG: dTDP-4-dehydrorhamnose 3,5-epimerase [Candidatus Tectomicrobia bacterium]|nr:dTDP-4-dehydrorhamnose 3,5-epimerase [Candidatus Tectomicrobia bacterium]